MGEDWCCFVSVERVFLASADVMEKVRSAPASSIEFWSKEETLRRALRRFQSHRGIRFCFQMRAAFGRSLAGLEECLERKQIGRKCSSKYRVCFDYLKANNFARILTQKISLLCGASFFDFAAIGERIYVWIIIINNGRMRFLPPDEIRFGSVCVRRTDCRSLSAAE